LGTGGVESLLGCKAATDLPSHRQAALGRTKGRLACSRRRLKAEPATDCLTATAKGHPEDLAEDAGRRPADAKLCRCQRAGSTLEHGFAGLAVIHTLCAERLVRRVSIRLRLRHVLEFLF
jgi:hypothetical protein